MTKYKSKLKRNSKYNPKNKRFIKNKVFNSVEYIQTCEDKVAFATLNKARQAKKYLKDPRAIYKCPNCGKYHLTTE